MSGNRFAEPAGRRSFRRIVRHSVAVSALASLALGSAAGSAGAQVSRSGFEVRPVVGGYLPTGDQRDFLKDAVLVGAQASWRLIPQFAITGTFAWSPSKDRVTPGDETLDVFQYDVGAEARAASWLGGGSWDFSPFVGLGVGGRTYDYRDLDLESQSNVAGYGALGGDLYFGRVGVRVEARDYVSRFEPFTGGDTKTRNDVTLSSALTFRF